MGDTRYATDVYRRGLDISCRSPLCCRPLAGWPRTPCRTLTTLRTLVSLASLNTDSVIRPQMEEVSSDRKSSPRESLWISPPKSRTPRPESTWSLQTVPRPITRHGKRPPRVVILIQQIVPQVVSRKADADNAGSFRTSHIRLQLLGLIIVPASLPSPSETNTSIRFCPSGGATRTVPKRTLVEWLDTLVVI